jgi:hypothetical protein
MRTKSAAPAVRPFSRWCASCNIKMSFRPRGRPRRILLCRAEMRTRSLPSCRQVPCTHVLDPHGITSHAQYLNSDSELKLCHEHLTQSFLFIPFVAVRHVRALRAHHSEGTCTRTKAIAFPNNTCTLSMRWLPWLVLFSALLALSTPSFWQRDPVRFYIASAVTTESQTVHRSHSSTDILQFKV